MSPDLLELITVENVLIATLCALLVVLLIVVPTVIGARDLTSGPPDPGYDADDWRR